MNLAIAEILRVFDKTSRPGDFAFQLIQALDTDSADKLIIAKLCQIQENTKEVSRRKEIENALVEILYFFYHLGSEERILNLEKIIDSNSAWKNNNLFLMSLIKKRMKQYSQAIQFLDLMLKLDASSVLNKNVVGLFSHCALQVKDSGLLKKAYFQIMSSVKENADYSTMSYFSQIVEDILSHWKPADLLPVRIALLGSFTTKQIFPILKLFCLRHSLYPEIYEADFNQIEQEILNTQSFLYQHKPEVVIIATAYRDILDYPAVDDSENVIEEKASSIFNKWFNLWNVCKERLHCTIIQNNFDLPLCNSLGHLSQKLSWSKHSFLKTLNEMLASSADDAVILFDLDRLSSKFGKTRWFSDKYWYLAKMAFSLEAIPLVCHNYAALISAVKGLTKKCLIVDLDNTLWGGIVGEDGFEGIQLGPKPPGNAFVEFHNKTFI